MKMIPPGDNYSHLGWNKGQIAAVRVITHPFKAETATPPQPPKMHAISMSIMGAAIVLLQGALLHKSDSTPGGDNHHHPRWNTDVLADRNSSSHHTHPFLAKTSTAPQRKTLAIYMSIMGGLKLLLTAVGRPPA